MCVCVCVAYYLVHTVVSTIFTEMDYIESFVLKDFYCGYFARDSKVTKVCDKNHKSPSLVVL